VSIWLILRNIGTVISFLRGIADIVGGVAKDKKAPPIEKVKSMLDDLEALLDSGAIDIPGVDEAAISEALKQIEEQLCRPKAS